jgi:hypothetical protein
MAQTTKKSLTPKESVLLLEKLKTRFEQNIKYHKDIKWADVEKKLKSSPEKIWSLNEMEKSGGEPDVVDFDKKNNQYVFYDCSAESPIGRRSFCYDHEALNKRKENKPINSAMEMAKNIGIEILTQDEYRALQELGVFDQKTSSWVETPENIRKLGGALFCDFRYKTVFVYHNGADSYYAARGFRGSLKV